VNSLSSVVIGVLVVVLVASGCNQRRPLSREELLELYLPTTGSVGFDIRSTGGNSGQSWTAVRTSAGKTAKFRIELDSAGVQTDKGFSLSVGKGRFISEPGSDSSAFLAELKNALEAKTLPTKIQRVPILDFDYAVLGHNQWRDKDGEFSDSPGGNWIAMKIFVGEGEGEGEVFLNLNPAIGKAEFSIKDSDYGDIVLRELAKVM
jgi:hypothetical protein